MFELIGDNFDASSAYVHDGLYIPEASDCMRCGLCLSNCPTFKINGIDAETPRSRIRTIDKILNQKSKVTGEELAHLNNCTQCRACEAICPSRMAYGQLFDLAQEQISAGRKNPLAMIGLKFIEHKSLLYGTMVLINAYQKSGLQYLARASGLLRRLKLAKAESLLPKSAIGQLAKIHASGKSHKGCVALFTGCIANYFDRETLSASIKMLNHIGYDVFVPNEQGCCGAIHQHQGQPQTAETMAKANAEIFNALNVDAVIYVATGCGLMLTEYRTKLKHPLFDISEFLNSHWNEHIQLKPRPEKVAVHEPCSQRNNLKNQQHVYDLLAKIPGLAVVPLPENQLCCGAGGVHVLTHPNIAEALGNTKIEHFAQTGADLLLTSNIGCALHLSTGLESRKLVHPVVLLAAQAH